MSAVKSVLFSCFPPLDVDELRTRCIDPPQNLKTLFDDQNRVLRRNAIKIEIAEATGSEFL
jgi:hypothetical protein